MIYMVVKLNCVSVTLFTSLVLLNSSLEKHVELLRWRLMKLMMVLSLPFLIDK